MTITDLQKKSLDADLSVAPGERAFIARITSAVMDRDGEVVLPQGMNSTEFEKNPVVFLSHDYSQLPIGRVTSIDRGTTDIKVKVVIATRPADHHGEWVPDTVLSLIQQGIIKGVSIGFKPTEVRNPTAKDKATFGDQVQRVFSKWNLLELSVAPLPANQDALILAVSKGLKSPAIAAMVAPPSPVAVTATPSAKRVIIIAWHDTAAPQRVDVKRQIADAVEHGIAKARGKFYIPA